MELNVKPFHIHYSVPASALGEDRPSSLVSRAPTAATATTAGWGLLRYASAPSPAISQFSMAILWETYPGNIRQRSALDDYRGLVVRIPGTVGHLSQC